ncbi:hypothetical protein DB30_05248 [Enhygromyxa salina]|uniref:Uncharacterized protein n=1 Tax=Enhygromyxa salina TaxID=215803 RepID=A0A0C2D200_9BACT|nr:hypothetical protein [Enhygromyxa salina]KIG15830.1 hypothetical protein DB30_05248 [Enhygromyxa salina]
MTLPDRSLEPRARWIDHANRFGWELQLGQEPTPVFGPSDRAWTRFVAVGHRTVAAY